MGDADFDLQNTIPLAHPLFDDFFNIKVTRQSKRVSATFYFLSRAVAGRKGNTTDFKKASDYLQI